MRIRAVKVPVAGKYTVTLSTEDFTTEEEELLTKFGEPLVETGGTFTSGAITFTLASDPRKLKSGLGGVSQTFDSADYADAEQRANIWAATVDSRIVSAVTALRSKIDSFSGVTVKTV